MYILFMRSSWYSGTATDFKRGSFRFCFYVGEFRGKIIVLNSLVQHRTECPNRVG